MKALGTLDDTRGVARTYETVSEALVLDEYPSAFAVYIRRWTEAGNCLGIIRV